MVTRRRTRRRRSSSRRAAPRRRSRRSRIRHRVSKGIGSQWGKISSAISGVVFLAQITVKEREAGLYTGKSKGEQGKILVDNVLHNIIGWSPFGTRFSGSGQNFNVDGIANKYVGAGILSWIYGSLPIKGLPHKGKAKVLGRKVAFAGAIGGLLDSPSGQQRAVSNRPTSTGGLVVTTV